MGNISKNLDQAMSKKKKKKKKKVAEEEGGTQRKYTHSSLGLTRPNFAFGRNF